MWRNLLLSSRSFNASGMAFLSDRRKGNEKAARLNVRTIRLRGAAYFGHDMIMCLAFSGWLSPQ